MAKFSTKALHALIDELADEGKQDMLTALHTILLGQASAADNDSDLDLNLDDEDDGKGSKKSGGGKRGKKRRGGKKSDDSDDDDAGDDADDDDEGDDDDELNLGDLDVEDDEDDKKGKKSGKKSRRGKKAKDEDDSDDGDDDADAGDDDDGGDDAPELEDAEGFEAFLDECDEHTFEPVDANMRELANRLSNEFDVDVGGIPMNSSPKELKKMSPRDIRKEKTLIYGMTLAKMLHVQAALVDLGDDAIEEIAEAEQIDLDDVTGKGKTKTLNMANEVVKGIYGGEDEE